MRFITARALLALLIFGQLSCNRAPSSSNAANTNATTITAGEPEAAPMAKPAAIPSPEAAMPRKNTSVERMSSPDAERRALRDAYEREERPQSASPEELFSSDKPLARSRARTAGKAMEKKKPPLNSNAIGGTKRKPTEYQHANRTVEKKKPPLNSNAIGGTRRARRKSPSKPNSTDEQERKRRKENQPSRAAHAHRRSVAESH